MDATLRLTLVSCLLITLASVAFQHGRSSMAVQDERVLWYTDSFVHLFSMLILPLLLWLTRDRWILLARSAIEQFLGFLAFEVSSIASNVILET